MVSIILGTLQFEAQKFETRTMPTPDMKGKEMIYWIRVTTQDRRLFSDLRRFLAGSAKYIDLKVPGAFIWTKAELEDYKFEPNDDALLPSPLRGGRRKGYQETEGEVKLDDKFSVEIVLRRSLAEDQRRQSPYG